MFETKRATSDKFRIMTDLEKLANLLSDRNSIEKEIGSIIGRPAITGHIGEYIAADIFDIELSESASEKSLDGYFQSGHLVGSRVNIKYYTVRGRILDITPDSLPDYYLVMMGESIPRESSRGMVYPAKITSVHLFESVSLMGILKERGVKIGIATSVIQSLWECAEMYPRPKSSELTLSDRQVKKLALFR